MVVLDNAETPDPAESSPLLQDNPSNLSDTEPDLETIPDDRPLAKRLPSIIAAHWATWKIIYVCGAFLFIIDYASFLGEPSRLRMLEAAVCRRYYEAENPLLIGVQDDVPEALCKVDEIQEEVALIRSWMIALDSLCGVLMGLPWGVVADKKGRRFVTFISVTGIMLGDFWYIFTCYFYKTFSPRAAIAAGLSSILGGGSTTLAGIITGICADTASANLRANVLFYISATVMISIFISPPLAALLLEKFGYWISISIGDGLVILSTGLLWFMPTVSKTKHRHVTGGDEEINDINGEACTDHHETSDEPRSWTQKVSHQFTTGLASVKLIIDMIFTSPYMVLGMLILILTKGGGIFVSFIPQYVSKRFNWPISKASYMISVQSGVSILMLLLVLPAAHKILMAKTKLRGPALDLVITKASWPFQACGLLLLGLSASPASFIFSLVVYIMGIGGRATVESYLSSLITPDKMATLYVLINVIDTLGLMIASPLVSEAFSKGLHMGGKWVGLPFIGASVLYLAASGLTMFLRVQRKPTSA